jgi:hypothetical protein
MEAAQLFGSKTEFLYGGINGADRITRIAMVDNSLATADCLTAP